jgi:hypothetical protein
VLTNRWQWEVFVSAQIPVVAHDLPPGASGTKWSPISSTLISGKSDAVLVDTAITVDQDRKLVDWIADSGKNLTTIYATMATVITFWRKQNSETISQSKVCRDARGNRWRGRKRTAGSRISARLHLSPRLHLPY